MDFLNVTMITALAYRLIVALFEQIKNGYLYASKRVAILKFKEQ